MLIKLVSLVALGAAVLTPVSVAAAPRTSGIAKYYSPGVMERVLVVRGMTRPGGISGLAAMPDCSMIGKVVLASINGNSAEKYYIIDCSAPGDRPKHIRQGLVIEVDYRSAVRNRFTRMGSAPARILSISKK